MITAARPGNAAVPGRIRLHPAARLVGALPVHAALWVLCAVWLVPAAGLFVSSFRTEHDVAASGWWTALWHPAFTLANYREVLAGGGMAHAFMNSVLIAVPATVIPLLVAAYAAYAFAWMRFPGRRVLFAVVAALLIVPLQTTFIPVLQMFTALHLAGTFGAVWLAHTGYGLPLAVFLLRNFIGGLPAELIDAAAIDGASAVDTFFRLVLPLALPALAALAIFQFLWVWNDLLVALIYLGGDPAVAPMTVTISNLVNSLGSGWHLLTAAAFVSMALPLAVFFSLQRYFVRGVLAGALKG